MKENKRTKFIVADFFSDVINFILFGFKNSSMQILTFHSSARKRKVEIGFEQF